MTCGEGGMDEDKNDTKDRIMKTSRRSLLKSGLARSLTSARVMR